MVRLCSIAILVLCLASSALADISSPLGGYYRAGKYMPLRVDLEHASSPSSLAITGEGMIESRLPVTSRHTQAILPILVTGSLRQMRWQAGESSASIDIPWRPLASNERLVGVTTLDKTIANQLYRAIFEGDRVESVRLDSSDPLPGPAVGWQTLDAVILDSGDRLDPAKMQTLLAGGTLFIIRSERAPDARWPWRRIDVPSEGSSPVAFWVLRQELRGPRLTETSTDAFRTALEAGWPAAYRLRIIVCAVAFATAILLVALLRSRWAAAAAIVLSLVTAGGLSLWWRGRAPVRLRTASVIVQREGAVQNDEWAYRTSLGRGIDRATFADLTFPLFSPDSGEPAHLALICREDGRPAQFVYDTAPGGSIAFISRSVVTDFRPPALSPLDDSQLRMLIHDAYRPCEGWGLHRIAPASEGPANEYLGAGLIDARP